MRDIETTGNCLPFRQIGLQQAWLVTMGIRVNGRVEVALQVSQFGALPQVNWHPVRRKSAKLFASLLRGTHTNSAKIFALLKILSCNPPNNT